MDPDIRKSLKAKIEAKTDVFGLNDIFMESYSRQFSPNQQLSATDCAFAITSLLERPFTQSNTQQEDEENKNPNRMQFNSNQA